MNPHLALLELLRTSPMSFSEIGRAMEKVLESIPNFKTGEIKDIEEVKELRVIILAILWAQGYTLNLLSQIELGKHNGN